MRRNASLCTDAPLQQRDQDVADHSLESSLRCCNATSFPPTSFPPKTGAFDPAAWVARQRPCLLTLQLADLKGLAIALISGMWPASLHCTILTICNMVLGQEQGAGWHVASQLALHHLDNLLGIGVGM
eukprot:1159311-Pelagomonas_calceolata.AAC.6